jgi:Lipin/Ned1/Smp2 multi-domain protein middle domain
MSSSSSDEGEGRPMSIEPGRKQSDQSFPDKYEAASDNEVDIKSKKTSIFKKIWNALSRKNKKRVENSHEEDDVGIELSLCGTNDIKFSESLITFDEFSKNYSAILANELLRVKIDNQIYNWRDGEPLLLSLLVFKKPIIALMPTLHTEKIEETKEEAKVQPTPFRRITICIYLISYITKDSY